MNSCWLLFLSSIDDQDQYHVDRHAHVTNYLDCERLYVDSDYSIDYFYLDS